MNDRFVEDLKSRLDIVEIVRKYAELKKSGKNYMCRSPFRNERTPSFCVSPDKQFWYDFGVSEGGDVISFIEKIENVSFMEAVEILADTAGVTIPKDNVQKKGPSKDARESLYELHEVAAEYFVNQLKNHVKTRAYLHDRGIRQETIDDWKLGYGGHEEQGLTKYLLQKGYSEKEISTSGVAFERQFGTKTMQDRFADRVILPVCEPREGRIIAFTGRDLSGTAKAKYLNSPENPVYHKSSTLFGMDRARNVIRDKESAILVEGNFDVLSMHQIGFKNTIATCGTALTEEHLRQLKRITKHLYLAFDADVAGKKATLRAMEMILPIDITPRIVDLTGVKDVDELIQKDPEELKKRIKDARNGLLFLFEKFAEKYLDDTLEGEKYFLDAFFALLTLVNRPIERDEFISRISKRTNRPKSIIQEEFEAYERKHKSSYTKPTSNQNSLPKFSRAECFVGFVCAFKDDVSGWVNDDVLSLLPKDPALILERFLTQKPLSPEQEQQRISWQLYQENLYDETTGNDVLREHFQEYITHLKKIPEKEERNELAKRLRSNPQK